MGRPGSKVRVLIIFPFPEIHFLLPESNSFAPSIMKQSLTSLIDFFYPPFRRWMTIETFRYASCGSANTLLGLFIYYLGYHFIFNKEVFNFGLLAFKPHNAALFLSFIVSFLVGFLLNRYVVFTGSNLRGRIQLFRYFLSFLFNLTLNYFLLKILVEYLGWDAFLSQLLTTIVVITFSYLSQKHFSFKTK
jgi:putative flippase GtrA